MGVRPCGCQPSLDGCPILQHDKSLDVNCNFCQKSIRGKENLKKHISGVHEKEKINVEKIFTQKAHCQKTLKAEKPQM